MVFNFRQFGINIEKATNMKIHSNLVMHIQERTTFETTGMEIDFWGGIAICSLGFTRCVNVQAHNNIVAGVTYVGFGAPGHACGKPNLNFIGNVAHSVKGKAGYGAIIYADSADKAQGSCTEASGFFAYKCNTIGLTGGYKSGPKINIYRNNTVLDSKTGMAFGWAGKFAITDKAYVEVS